MPKLKCQSLDTPDMLRAMYSSRSKRDLWFEAPRSGGRPAWFAMRAMWSPTTLREVRLLAQIPRDGTWVEIKGVPLRKGWRVADADKWEW